MSGEQISQQTAATLMAIPGRESTGHLPLTRLARAYWHLSIKIEGISLESPSMTLNEDEKQRHFSKGAS